jgi:hypothetical protein
MDHWHIDYPGNRIDRIIDLLDGYGFGSPGHNLILKVHPG